MYDDILKPPSPFEHRTSERDISDYAMALSSTDSGGETRALFRRWAAEDDAQERAIAKNEASAALSKERHTELLGAIDETTKKAAYVTSNWYTKEEAAKYLRVSQRTIDRARERGELKERLMPGTTKILFHKDDLDALPS